MPLIIFSKPMALREILKSYMVSLIFMEWILVASNLSIRLKKKEDTEKPVESSAPETGYSKESTYTSKH